MNLISLITRTSSPVALNPTPAASAHAESPAMPFLLPTAAGEGSSSSEAASPATNGLTAEKAQPLMESLQAQLSYRGAMGQGQNTDRLASSSVDQPRANLASPDAPTQAESSATPSVLATEEGDGNNATSSATVNGLTAEKAQPLMESLQAQLSYRGVMGQGQNSDHLAADFNSQPLDNQPPSNLILAMPNYRVGSEAAANDEVSAHDPDQPEQEENIGVSSLFFFPPPISHAFVGGSEQSSSSSSGIDNAPLPLFAEQALADATPPGAVTVISPADGSTALSSYSPPHAVEQGVLTLPLTLSSDQNGYAQPLVSALSGHLTWQISHQQQSVELQLHPAELGAMTITLHMNAGTLQLHMHAEVPETQQLLQQTANELKESLTLSQGGQVAVDVSSQGHQQRRQAPQPQQTKVASANHLSLADTQTSATDHSILITL